MGVRGWDWGSCLTENFGGDVNVLHLDCGASKMLFAKIQNCTLQKGEFYYMYIIQT